MIRIEIEMGDDEMRCLPEVLRTVGSRITYKLDSGETLPLDQTMHSVGTDDTPVRYKIERTEK